MLSRIQKFLFDTKARNEFLELRRISKIPRYRPGISNILGPQLFYTDSSSFIFTYREIFKHEIYKFKTNQDAPFIIDGGANIGMASLYFKTKYPKSKIMAFEPDKQIFDTLSKNIASFGFTNVALINKGLWSEDTVLSFHSDGADGGKITSDKSDSAASKIEVTNINNFLSQPIDFLKLDIEGAEFEVLNACKNNLHQVNRMFIEYHSFYNEPQKLDELLHIIRESGFRVYVNAPGFSSLSPLYEITVENKMDFQLNIFAYRTNEDSSFKHV
jgi:FkbM family methyltransferase